MAGLLLSGTCVIAQESPAAPASGSTLQSSDVRALADSLTELKAQMKLMSARMEEMQREQARSHEETLELRRKLEAADKGAIALGGPGVGYGPVAKPAQTAPTVQENSTAAGTPIADQVAGDRVAALEENHQLLDSKINDIYQTKVESGSKYRLRLSGIVLLNLYGNRGWVDNQDVPQLADSAYPNFSNGAVGGSLRQSQIGLEAFGPTIAGAQTSADIKFDFAGGFSQSPYGTTAGLVRLRTGTIRLDWANTSLIAGQDSLFFAPLAPTSLASLAQPALSYNGNLWSWTPQVRVEHTTVLSDSTSLIFSGGILDSLTGENPLSTYERTATYGEASGQPSYAARVALRQRIFGQQWTLGFGGFYERQNWAFGRIVNGWAGTTDLSAPLGKNFEFSGEFYRGRAVGGIGGGIGQSVLLSGPIYFASTQVKGLDSMGGWAQLKFKPKPKWEINAAVGQDNPFASELLKFQNTFVYGVPLAKNSSGIANVIYRIRSDVLLSAEYQRLRTVEIDGDRYRANHISFSVGYVF
jgi:hypothetical protein